MISLYWRITYGAPNAAMPATIGAGSRSSYRRQVRMLSVDRHVPEDRFAFSMRWQPEEGMIAPTNDTGGG